MEIAVLTSTRMIHNVMFYGRKGDKESKAKVRFENDQLHHGNFRKLWIYLCNLILFVTEVWEDVNCGAGGSLDDRQVDVFMGGKGIRKARKMLGSKMINYIMGIFENCGFTTAT